MNNLKELINLLRSFKTTDVLIAALELELFDKIEALSPTTNELGNSLNISNINALEILLRILEKYKLIVEYDKKWFNMPVIRDNLANLDQLKTQIHVERNEWSQLSKQLMQDANESEFLSFSKPQDIDLTELREYFPKFTIFSNWNYLPFMDSSEADNNTLDDKPYVLILSSEVLYGLNAHEIEECLRGISQFLGQNSYLVIYGPFMDDSTLENLFDDLEIALQTGEIISSASIKKILKRNGFFSTENFRLRDGNAIFFAAQNPESLNRLNLSELDRLKERIKNFGFKDVIEIDADQVITAPFTQNLCDYGCRSGSNPSYMKKCSHHNKHNYQKTREILDSYSKILLLCGEPPTGDFQKRALQAQAEAFKSGYYKAFVYWAGPCSVCEDCEEISYCRNPQTKRPSMEGAGIDVFATVENAGKPIHTLRHQGEYIHYFALLLLE